MAYDTANPPALMLQGGVGNQHPAMWSYESEDGAATVDGAGYITNAKKLGMKVGDIVYVTDTNASPLIVTTHIVATISASTGAADLTDTGATVGTTVGD
jgi:hypothetical protein